MPRLGLLAQVDKTWILFVDCINIYLPMLNSVYISVLFRIPQHHSITCIAYPTPRSYVYTEHGQTKQED